MTLNTEAEMLAFHLFRDESPPQKALPKACRGKRICDFVKTRSTNKLLVLVTVKLIKSKNVQSSRKEAELQTQHSKLRIPWCVCVQREGENEGLKDLFFSL